MKVPNTSEVFVARITRKELKTDKFALEVEHTVNFFEEHQKEIIRYGGIGLVAIALVLGWFTYSRHQHTAREEALAKAIQVQESTVGPPQPGQNRNFPTQASKDQAATQAFTLVKTSYAGSEEAEVAEYYLGSIRADQGNLAEAEKSFKEVSDHGNARYSSLAKLSLAQIYFADGRGSQGESVLRDLMAHPTIFVSKEQAIIMLARYEMLKNPAEARKLLDPLRNQPGGVGEVALALYAQIPQ
jgi:predicted negative regulator of RcsB-dependent stress response